MASMQISRRKVIASAALASMSASVAAPWLLADDEQDFKFRYLLSSCMYGYADLSDLLPEVARTGASGIDLWPMIHGNQREQLDEIGEERFAATLRTFRTYLGCITQFRLGPFALQDEMRLAQRLGCGTLVTGAVGPKGLSGSELKAAVAEFLEQMKPHLEVAEETGVTIAIENHANNLIESPDAMKWLVDLRPSPHLALALAPYHLPQDADQLAKLIRELGDSIAVFYAWQHGMGALESISPEQQRLQLPGQGDLDFAPLVAALHDIDYSGWTAIFMHPGVRGTPIMDSIEGVTKEINRSREYLEEHLAAIIDAQVIDTPAKALPEKGIKMAQPQKRSQSTIQGEYNLLSSAEAYVILNQGTEPPGPGGYTMTKDPGTYICRQCNAILYRAEDKFESHCGWPSFDDEIEGAVTRRPDDDGHRVEIVCSNCGGHLGHVFEGEQMTAKDTRHCVNSISMRFIKKGDEIPAKIVKKTTDP
jgi:methionine-R-sulfoxide reductase